MLWTDAKVERLIELYGN